MYTYKILKKLPKYILLLLSALCYIVQKDENKKKLNWHKKVFKERFVSNGVFL